MADLVNLLTHMAGKGVLVNGTVYPIDQEGLAQDVKDEDAAKLLQSKAWMVFDPEAAAKREERRKALREEYKQQRGGIQLLTKDGQMVDPQEINKAQAKAAEKAAAERALDYPSMKPEKSGPHAPEVDAGVKPEEPIPPEVEAATHEEQGTSGGEDEWPDPSVEMAKPYLQDMAHAYGELVDMIQKAMYDEI
jgi:glucan-binding YG repeat protein